MNKHYRSDQSDKLPPYFTPDYDNYSPEDLEAIRAQGGFLRFDQSDNGALITFAKALDYTKAKVYERKFPEIEINLLVPDVTDVPDYVEFYNVQTWDQIGMAKIIANYADDLPRADVRMHSVRVPVKTLGDSYGYSVNEIRASRRTGEGLDTKKAEAARRAVELKLASIKCIGDSDYGLHGLTNHPNLSEYILPNQGPWKDLSGEEIWENLEGLIDAYEMQSMRTHRANTLALPPPAYRAALMKRLEITQPTTPLQWFRELFPEIEVIQINEFIGAKDGDDMLMLMERNADNVSHQLVLPFLQLPPEARNLEFVTNCIARSAGVTLWYPLSLLSAVITDTARKAA
jgi:hypothetical protein